MRLVTRSDFDGLACAALLEELGIVTECLYTHPKDLQDGKIEITTNDVLANVPFVEGCGLWFDHHSSEDERLGGARPEFEGASYRAPSAAQVIWAHYGGVAEFGDRFVPLLEAVNKTDSADLSREEILRPQGWILLSFVMDPRTGLGRFRDYRISNYRLMQDMIEYCRTLSAEEIIELPDVQERTRRYFKQQEQFEAMLTRNGEIHGNVVVTNLMKEETIYSGNRFLVYALYPEQNVEVRVMWGRDKRNVVFAVGHSILNRTCGVDVGKLMLRFGGGGHEKVGTCQVDLEHWAPAFEEILGALRQGG